jgi:hypothetical protein
MDEPFWVWHQSEDASAGVAEPGDVRRGTVGIVGKRENSISISGVLVRAPEFLWSIAEGDLAIRPPGLDDTRVAGHDSPFRVRNGKLDGRESPEEDVLGRFRTQPDPDGGVLAVVVPRQRGIGLPVRSRRPRRRASRENSRLQQDLKTVADSQHEFVGLYESAYGVPQSAAKLPRKYDPRANIVPVAEATGDADDLKCVQKRWLLEQTKQMNAIRVPAARLEGERRLDVAVRSWRTQNANSWRSHEWSNPKREAEI